MRRLITICTLLFAATAIAEPIPLWKFFEPFDMNQVSISPEGTYLAASLLEGDGAEQDNKLQVLNRVTGERVISFGMPDKQRIASLRWADDETVIVSPARKIPNEEAYQATGGLMKVIVKTGQTIDLFAQRERGGGVFHTLPEDPDHMLVAHQSGRYVELYKMHLLSGAASSKIARAPALGGGFILTPDLQDVAFHVGGNDDAETLVHERTENGEWKLLTRTAFDQKGWVPLRAAYKPNEYFTRDARNPKGIAALGIYNRVTREHKEVYIDDTFDILGPIADQTGNVWGLSINHHFPRVMYLNPTHPLAQAHKMIRLQFPESTVSLASYSFDHKLVLAYVSSSNSLPEIVILDAEKGSIDQITNRAEEIGITSDELAPMEPFLFSARDNKTIFGYLTSRKDTPRPGPMVVYVHGGPLGIRDSWGFSGVVQVLASRGYHVMQVNFRGSGGRGTEFVKAGFREYGGKMQDDVTDATLWAIQQGIAAKDRICISGGSYGAYAAIMGAAKEPDLYQCAIGQSGLYDPVLTLRIGDLARRVASVKQIRQTMGRTQEEREAISVINVAGDVKAAVMLIHGGQDRRTPPEHYHRMKEAFDKVGKQVVTHYKGNQGHSWFGRDTIMDLYGRQLAFLDEHIGSETDKVQAVSTTN
ncbi:MAG: prolyl oligopeptidase family serine peptidase [Gammaproteobacteria bacterium]|nr:prolyl oligopeptidase family serine peptidase [Gammaproteobacteria bacterium]